MLVVSQVLDNLSVQKMHIINDKEIPIIYLYWPTGKNFRLCLVSKSCNIFQAKTVKLKESINTKNYMYFILM
jgi:hypothetical protein